ncbi:MAG TPA: Dabb family protein [Vicinamibacterales bacterium]|nr:Dabb family protein [Vicinamibacterales bacterium]
MIAHVVLFQPKHDLSPDERRGLAEAFSAAVTQIPSVRRARVGRRVRHGRPYERLMTVDYSHAVVIEFDDVAGLMAYLNDPVHDQLATRFFAGFEHALMYDFDLGEGDPALTALLDAAEE